MGDARDRAIEIVENIEPKMTGYERVLVYRAVDALIAVGWGPVAVSAPEAGDGP